MWRRSPPTLMSMSETRAARAALEHARSTMYPFAIASRLNAAEVSFLATGRPPSGGRDTSQSGTATRFALGESGPRDRFPPLSWRRRSSQPGSKAPRVFVRHHAARSSTQASSGETSMSLSAAAIHRENSLSSRKVLNTASSRRISAKAARSIRFPSGPALHALETHWSSSEVPRTFSWCAERARGNPGKRIVRRVMHPGWRTCEWEGGKLRLGAEGIIEWARGGERASVPGCAAADRTGAPAEAARRLAGNASALPAAPPTSMPPRGGPSSSVRPGRSPDRDPLSR